MATYFLTMDSPIGFLRLSSDENQLKSISFDAEAIEDPTTLPGVLIEARKQLNEYFSGTRCHFELPLAPDGSDFQQLVWKQLAEVPFGSTRSYLDIAKALGSETSSRAVGMANGRNPIPLVIPCHRIIGQNGKLTGYAGGLARKKWLLIHERTFTGGEGLF